MRGLLLPATVLFIAMLASFVAEYWPLLLALAGIAAVGGIAMPRIFRSGGGARQRESSHSRGKNDQIRRRTTARKRRESGKGHREQRPRNPRGTEMLVGDFQAGRNFVLQPKHVRRKSGRANDPWYDGPRHREHRVSRSESAGRAPALLEVVSSATTPWHSVKSDVYHNNVSCRKGSKIRPEYIRSGEGGRKLCAHCAVLSGFVGGRRRNPT